MEMEAAVKHRTQFYIEDAMTMEYPENFYDVVYRWGAVRESLVRARVRANLIHLLLAAATPSSTSPIRRNSSGNF